MNKLFTIIICLLICAACNQSEESPSNPSRIVHNISTEAKPWTHAEIDQPAEQFSFAVFADLTGGERDSIFEVAVAQMNLLRPELIINVGDLIEGDYQTEADLHSQWDDFDRRARKASAPLFYVGGNHDLTDPTLWRVWNERYGPRYYHFTYKNTLFLVLDTEDHTPERVEEIAAARNRAMDSVEQYGWEVLEQTVYYNAPEQVGGNISETQAAYFEDVIRTYPDVMHTFLFMHKAPWKTNDPEFFRIEEALSNMKYTVFNGHVHAFDHEVRHGRDYLRLATTGGVFLPEKGRSVDHITWITVNAEETSIAHLQMNGILNKSARIPGGGENLQFQPDDTIH